MTREIKVHGSVQTSRPEPAVMSEDVHSVAKLQHYGANIATVSGVPYDDAKDKTMVETCYGNE